MNNLLHRRVMRGIATLVAVALLLACTRAPWDEPQINAIVVRNSTTTPLSFKIAVADREVDLLGPIQPGTSAPIIAFRERIADGPLTDARGCTKGVVTTYDPDGREVASHPAGLCVGETWTVEPE